MDQGLCLKVMNVSSENIISVVPTNNLGAALIDNANASSAEIPRDSHLQSSIQSSSETNPGVNSGPQSILGDSSAVVTIRFTDPEDFVPSTANFPKPGSGHYALDGERLAKFLSSVGRQVVRFRGGEMELQNEYTVKLPEHYRVLSKPRKTIVSTHVEDTYTFGGPQPFNSTTKLAKYIYERTCDFPLYIGNNAPTLKSPRVPQGNQTNLGSNEPTVPRKRGRPRKRARTNLGSDDDQSQRPGKRPKQSCASATVPTIPDHPVDGLTPVLRPNELVWSRLTDPESIPGSDETIGFWPCILQRIEGASLLLEVLDGNVRDFVAVSPQRVLPYRDYRPSDSLMTALLTLVKRQTGKKVEGLASKYMVAVIMATKIAIQVSVSSLDTEDAKISIRGATKTTVWVSDTKSMLCGAQQICVGDFVQVLQNRKFAFLLVQEFRCRDSKSVQDLNEASISVSNVHDNEASLSTPAMHDDEASMPTSTQDNDASTSTSTVQVNKVSTSTSTGQWSVVGRCYTLLRTGRLRSSRPVSDSSSHVLPAAPEGYWFSSMKKWRCSVNPNLIIGRYAPGMSLEILRIGDRRWAQSDRGRSVTKEDINGVAKRVASEALAQLEEIKKKY